MPAAIGQSAGLHGHDLRLQGFTVSQVVHDYGDVCQSIAELAIETRAPVSPEDFRLLNQCLDTAIAGALTQFGRELNQATIDSQALKEQERLGFMAHELRNLLNTAFLAFEAVESGGVGVNGHTGAVLKRSLLGASDLVAHSLLAISLTKGNLNRRIVPIAELFNELMPSAALIAHASRIRLIAGPIQNDLAIEIDPQVISSVLMNLIQNALKFTLPGTKVTIRAVASNDRVLIEIQDECGGLPLGNTDTLFSAFEQRGMDRTGIGLGLTYCRRAIEANNGQVHVRDMPGSGCLFTVDLPLASLEAVVAPLDSKLF